MTNDPAAQALADLSVTVLNDPSPDLFLSHLSMQTLNSLDCRGAILGIVQREGFLDLVGYYGYDDALVDPYSRMPLWTPMPITDAVRSGEITIFHKASELQKKYPHLSDPGLDENTCTISFPIKYRNTSIGALGVTVMKAPKNGFEKDSFTEGLIALSGLYIRNLLNKKAVNERDITTNAKSLTPRQKQIIELFDEDLTTDQMADRLRYSSSTIKQDIIKIYGIFGVNNRQAVVNLAKKAGIF